MTIQYRVTYFITNEWHDRNPSTDVVSLTVPSAFENIRKLIGIRRSCLTNDITVTALELMT